MLDFVREAWEGFGVGRNKPPTETREATDEMDARVKVGAVLPKNTVRYIAEPHCIPGLWRVRDTWFDGPGSVFLGPVVLVVTSEAAARRKASQLNG